MNAIGKKSISMVKMRTVSHYMLDFKESCDII